MTRGAIQRLTPDMRRAQTRAHLLAAAAEIFAERGFHGATLDEIADAAGFSKGAVYSNFASKEELFLTLIQAQGEEMVRAYAELDDSGQQDPAARVAALANVYLRRGADLTREWALLTEFELYALRNPKLLAQFNQNSRVTHSLVVDLVESQIDKLGIDSPLPAEDLATLFIGIFDGLWQQKALDPDSVPDDLAARAIVLISSAIETLGKPRQNPSGRRRGQPGRGGGRRRRPRKPH